MRSPEENEAIVLEYLNDKHPSYRKTADKYGIFQRIFGGWIKKYREQGIDGLRSQTGKTKLNVREKEDLDYIEQHL